MTDYIEDDGGRSAAGFKGYAGDCGVRAIAIVLDRRAEYGNIYDRLAAMHYDYCMAKAKHAHAHNKDVWLRRAKRSARNGLYPETIETFLREHGDWRYVNLTKFGESPARMSDLPTNVRIIIRFRKHFAAMLDGALHDTYDSSAVGMQDDRAVFGYWVQVPPRDSIVAPNPKGIIP